MFNPLHSVLEYQISYFPSLMSFRQLHFTAYIHDGGPAGPAMKHLATCFGLLYGRIFSDFLNLLTSQTISYTVSDGRCMLSLVFITVFQRSRRPTRLSCRGP